MKNVWMRSSVAIAIGITITASVAIAAHFAWSHGAETIANILLWPNSLLQSLVPDNPVHEGTPLNIAAYLASYPLGAIVYSGIAYSWLSRRRVQS